MFYRRYARRAPPPREQGRAPGGARPIRYNGAMLSEFDLIKHYFTRPRAGRATLGIGDDCALLTPTPGMQMAISSDMLVEGRHFFAGADARKLGHKSLAVNLSDLAAMARGRSPSPWRWRCRPPSPTGWAAFPPACSRWPTPTTAS